MCITAVLYIVGFVDSRNGSLSLSNLLNLNRCSLDNYDGRRMYWMGLVLASVHPTVELS